MDLPVKDKKYMIFSLAKANTKDGRPFLKMVLADDDRKLFNSIMYDSNRLSFEPKKGDVVSVSGTFQQFNNQPQLKVNEMFFVSVNGSEMFLPKSKNDPKEMADELRRTLQENISSTYFQNLLRVFYDDVESWELFQRVPAGKNVHHAYVYGLLEHTLAAVRLAVHISSLYMEVNKELLIIGALFHDIGKVRELDVAAGFEYSNAGRLHGHIVIGYLMLNDYIKRVEDFPETVRQQLLHMVLSHHGQLEFGSPQLPKTAEALLLSFIDDLDAKLNTFSSVLGKEEVLQGGWSSYNRLLERHIYRPPEEKEQKEE